MKNYKYIFIVLVYKNIDVLETFFDSLSSIDSYKVVLVNAYYDDESKKACETYATEHNADFVDIPNMGYGEGNNKGIEYARTKYSFEYLIVSNSDIIIKEFNNINGFQNSIIAPYTEMISGKKQNPNMPYHAFGICYNLLKWGYKNNSFIICKIAHAINRVNRIAFFIQSRLLNKDSCSIYSAHGSFFLIGNKALEYLYPLFDSEMFLYNEEFYLAEKCRRKGVRIIYAPSLIRVLHLEGASAGFDYKKQFGVHRESFLILDRKVREMDCRNI